MIGNRKSGEAKPAPVSGGEANRQAKRRQQFLAGSVVVVALLGIWGLSSMRDGPDRAAAQVDPDARQRILDASERAPDDLTTLEGVKDRMGEIGDAAGQNAEAIEGNKELLGEIQDTLNQLVRETNNDSANQAELEELRRRLEQLEAGRPANGALGELPEASALGSPVSPVQRTGARSPLIAPRSSTGANLTGEGGARTAVETRRSQQVFDLASDAGREAVEDYEEDAFGGLSDADSPDVFDTTHYVPPNAHAPATVVVGVDAGTGANAQGDPQVAAFVIQGPAQHVVDGEVIRETDLKGCLVNGSATGDLSTERVFIRLQKMTCPLPNGKVAVSEVEGHVTHNGKAGVRGQVISREGDVLTRAALAALAEGIGRGASSLGGGGQIGIGANGGLTQTDIDVERAGVAAFGSGVSSAGNVVSEYIIDRAKAYDPVVQMPTGINVELVFINGTLVRPMEENQ